MSNRFEKDTLYCEPLHQKPVATGWCFLYFIARFSSFPAVVNQAC